MVSEGTRVSEYQFLLHWGLRQGQRLLDVACPCKHSWAEMSIHNCPALVCLCAAPGQNPHEIFFPAACNARFQQKHRGFVHMLHCKGAVGRSDPKTSEGFWTSARAVPNLWGELSPSLILGNTCGIAKKTKDGPVKPNCSSVS